MSGLPERFLFTTAHPEFWPVGRVTADYRVTRLDKLTPGLPGALVLYEVFGVLLSARPGRRRVQTKGARHGQRG